MAVTAPADLVHACAWAIEQAWFINFTAGSESWDDDRLDEECEKYNEVFSLALVQPSTSLRDLVAKARLCLHDFEAQTFPFHSPEANEEPDDLAKMVITVLREVITLCA